MFIHAKQERVYALVILLLDGRPMTSAELTQKLKCSSATLTRTIRDARESYGVCVEFKKERQQYEISNAETLS